MPVLTVLAYISFGAAALLVFFGLTDGGSFFVSGGISAAVAGVLFLAIDRIITVLSEIRDRLPRASDLAPTDDRRVIAGSTELTGDALVPNRSPALLDADLARMKERIGRGN